MIRRPPSSTLFPSTTLSRSRSPWAPPRTTWKMLGLTRQLSSCCNPPLVYSFNVAPPVRPIGPTSMTQPFRLPCPRKSLYQLLDLLPLFGTAHTDKGKSDLSEAQCD